MKARILPSAATALLLLTPPSAFCSRIVSPVKYVSFTELSLIQFDRTRTRNYEYYVLGVVLQFSFQYKVDLEKGSSKSHVPKFYILDEACRIVPR